MCKLHKNVSSSKKKKRLERMQDCESKEKILKGIHCFNFLINGFCSPEEI